MPHGLHLPRLDERSVFGAGLVRDARRYERFLDWDWVAATLASLAALAAMVRRGRVLAPRLGLGRVNAGIVLGVVTLTVIAAAALPFGLASNWWERRHGISREGYAGPVFTAWTTLLQTTLVAVVALALVLGLAKRFDRGWWLAGAPLLAGVALVLQLLVPLLATVGTHPLRDPGLTAAIRRLEAREHAGRPLVREDDVSSRTTEANAFAVGVGPTARIVIWNTLIDGFAPAQVRFVAAHELAHLARNHILRGVGWFALLALPLLGLIALTTRLPNPAAVPLALLVFTAAQLAFLPVRNAISRRYESEADWIALRGTHDPAAGRSLFVGFVATSLQDPSPPGWVQILLDDHPTPLQRVELMRAWRLRNR